MLSKRRILSVSNCTLALFAFAATAANAAPATSPTIGHAYVNDNTAVVNTLAGFDRHADGSLAPIPGSPFSVGDSGTSKGLAFRGSDRGAVRL